MESKTWRGFFGLFSLPRDKLFLQACPGSFYITVVSNVPLWLHAEGQEGVRSDAGPSGSPRPPVAPVVEPGEDTTMVALLEDARVDDDDELTRLRLSEAPSRPGPKGGGYVAPGGTPFVRFESTDDRKPPALNCVVVCVTSTAQPRGW